ncbi:MurR/RpiR family transcriptional regulator [Clostridium sp. ZS2-4]|uniref:MurR/RpiR family transcriptional regulator n=1 Tax=Clostridium sp. ZS2-4 TaxID=2987703 RepID=UPI00227D620B|nr:SIS domain-containing protein [Clostridium sp. ZS2-4]MCY6354214.1 SIS domain-containing protein [Clostridium sp. ZS2-4]
MISIDIRNLNSLEKQIYDILMEYSKNNPKFRINQAAHLCNCSVSKISKFVKKLGFSNFKQYLDFLYGKEMPHTDHSDELTRIKNFIDDFDSTLTNDFLELIKTHEKIVLFGYGPSLLCAQYFEYRLRTCLNKIVMAVSDELSVTSMIDENTLLVFITVSGTFRSFEKLYHDAKIKNCDVAMVMEEYNTALFDQCDKIFWLSKIHQPSYLKAYEKSRTLFFIFLEEVVLKIQSENRTLAETKDHLNTADS